MELEIVLSELSEKIGDLPTVLDTKVLELAKKIDSLHECVDDKFESVDADILGVKEEVKFHLGSHDEFKTVVVKCAVKTLFVVALVVICVFVSHIGPLEISKVALGLIGG